MGRGLSIAALAAATAGLLCGAAGATELYGTDFAVVYDPTTLGLFGSLSLVGDTLEFTPNNFIATSLNGQGTVTPTGATTASGIELIANHGFQFGSLQLTEFGDYLLSGANSSVSVSGELIAFGTTNPVSTYTTSTITPSAALPLNLNSGSSQNWSATAAIDNTTQSVYGSSGWLANSSTIDVSIENLLSATTPVGLDPSEALIQKKAAFGGVGIAVTPVVPLPSPIWLLAGGLAALFAVQCGASRSQSI